MDRLYKTWRNKKKTYNIKSLFCISCGQLKYKYLTEMQLKFFEVIYVSWIINWTIIRGLSQRANCTDLLLSAKLVPTFANGGCHVVSVTDLYGQILVFLDRSRYFSFQVAPRFYSRGWVDSVPDPLLLRKSGSAGNRSRTSGPVDRNSDHWTTEAAISF
jgi:hypothetical protein